jgi:DNA invertase Pin-like site-specific DNA recombinase
MSTDHQRYSTENQSDAIALYAAKNGMEIVRRYKDEGKSGLRVETQSKPESERGGEGDG